MEGKKGLVTVRPVTETDAAEVCMICCEDLGYQCDKTLVKLRISQLDTEREAVFVAIFENRIVGFIHVERYNTLYFETMANILGLAVSSKVRKHGIGKALVEKAEDWANENDIALMRLNSGPEAHYIYPNGDEVSNFEIVYVCRKWHGEPKSQDGEMEDLRFLSVGEIVLSEISPPIRSVVEKYISQADA